MNEIWEHAARAAGKAAAQIRDLAGTDPAAADDAAWAASDTLHTAAAALGSRILRQAADAYDRAARAPLRTASPRPPPAGNSLRRAARLHLRVRLPDPRSGAWHRSFWSPGSQRSPRRLPGCAKPSSAQLRPPAHCVQPNGYTPPRRHHVPRQRPGNKPKPGVRQRWPAHRSAPAQPLPGGAPAPGGRRPAPAQSHTVAPSRPVSYVTAPTPEGDTMDPSDAYPDPFGEALSYSFQRAAQMVRWSPPESRSPRAGRH